MDLMRQDPSRMLNDLRQELNRFFTGGWPPNETDDQSNVVTSQWMPAVDIREEPNRFVLYADIPGIDPKDIEITMENGVLTIRGERETEAKTDGERYTRYERAHGAFYRRFALPNSADPEKVQAHGKNGVLEVVIPKTEAVQPRKIAVQS